MSIGVAVAVAVLGLCLIILMLGILYWRRYLRTKRWREKDLTGLDLQTSSFTLKQIKAATNNFDPVNKIGEGGFGPVYKGLLSNGTIIVVKQLSSKSRQGNREFLNEIGIISCLQHPNLVKIYGCCIEKDQLLLIYEYMENNSLARALFGHEHSQLKLDWPTRHRICLGVAKGLAFLHEESRFKIVHRDIKPTNVLLDRDLNPKISDFGLAKLDEEEKTHISTRIAGTIGYMAPEYAMWGYLTYKADVYSFGIVSLEIVTFVQPRLDPIEAAVVRQIASTLGANLTNPNDDPCQSGKIYITQTYATGTDIENNITCNYYDGNYSHVTNFDLTRNYLSGELPKEWATMQHLKTISLTGTGISGEIPKEWGNFPNLTYLSLEANQLSGPISEELGNLISLTTLILSSNQFVGSLPITLENLTELKDFRISDNSFNGTVPEFIGRWTKLKRLEMYSSGLEGPINATIFALENLKNLRITDMIGPEFDFPKLINKNMEYLVLRNCSMSGSIPAYIWDSMDTLVTLDLSFNKLKGGITNINRKPRYIFLSGNMLTGTIPGSFLTTSQHLDLSYNNFTSPTSCQEISSSRINMYQSFSWEHNIAGRRIFDIYIQGILKWENFNIKEQANGTDKAIVKTFNATVIENTLEIHLYWAGKGTTVIPGRGYYGLLISAISVCRGFRANCDGTFSFRQLKAATNNFNSANKIGEGGFGSVCKGQLSDGTVIAVKQLSSKSLQGNREFVNEIGMISGLQHPNLVKLFGCCVQGSQLLLVYEYMENNCLAHALFGKQGDLCVFLIF
ncbi:hypothetical protein Q3G72_000412 [Acer saccharum]|nr:hypothetical protein Q3G72_000412 [Acer saccharum]